MAVQERNIAVAIILSIVTCGIYGLYWIYKMTEELKVVSGDESLNGVLAVVLPLVTCGIYAFYWYYKCGKAVFAAKQKVGLQGDDKSVIYLVLGLVGLGIVSMALIQNELNEVARTGSPVQA